MKWKYPQEVHDFVREWCKHLRDADLARECNERFGTEFTKESMRAFRGNHGYRNGMGHGRSKEEYMKASYPEGLYEYVRDNSWGVPSKEMAEQVNERFGTHFTPSGLKQFRQRHGIKSGLTGWFREGREPGNKGKRMEEYASPEAIAKSAKTRFKPGHRPANELQVGDIRQTRDGYLLRKKSMEGSQWERWEVLHRAVWEEHNGPISEGMMVTFLDGDKTNCSIENLVLISKRENQMLLKRGYRTGDPELTRAGIAAIRLELKAKDRKKERAEK